MTIQELINTLQYSIDEYGFDPNSNVQIDAFDAHYEFDTYWDIHVDYTAQSEPRGVCINAYISAKA
tara:strand:- start:1101 stop:1298 length:198 start_codon:yes stop_codon:yes gene_type:complete